MALITIETMDDEEADIIKGIMEQLDFSTTVNIKYEDEQGAHGLDYPLSNQSEVSDLNC